MIKSKEKNPEKYASLCRELLKLNKFKQPTTYDLETFVQEPSVSTFFEHTANHFISLWNNRDNNPNLEHNIKNKICPKELGKVISPDKNDPRLQSNEFVPYSSLCGNYNNESDEIAFSSTEKQSDKKTEQEINSLNHQDFTDKKEKETSQKGKENSLAKAKPDEKITPPASLKRISKKTNMNNNNLTLYFKLPNARCGKAYNSGFEISSDPHSGKPLDAIANNFDIIAINGLETTGLVYNQDKKKIIGIPAKSGEINIEIIFNIVNTGKEHKTHCLFIINPDPKYLWKDKPSDENTLFWKKNEEEQELLTDNGWTLIGASKRGRSHAHEGKCRDDHFFISVDSPSKWNILAVADGAGSASFSREGARLAVMESSRRLSEKLDEFDLEIIDILIDGNYAEHGNRPVTLEPTSKKRLKGVLYNIFSLAVYEAVKAIHNTLNQHDNLKFRDFHTTLLLTAHKKIQGHHFIASYWIGDGGIAVYCENKSVTILGKPDSGEFAGQTSFLDNNSINKEDIYKRICFHYQDSITALILLTDGITDPFFETDHNLSQLDYWDTIWKEKLKKLISDTPGKTGQNLLDWLDFWSQGNHDDRTIAMLFKKEIK